MNHNQKQRALIERLEAIPKKLISDDFLKNKGLGNEIGFYIFDYAPESENLVREQLDVIERKLKRKGRTFASVNLFKVLFQQLEAEGVLEDAFELHKEEGNESLVEALQGILSQENFGEFLCRKICPEEQEFVLLSGLGACWPLIRGHSLLNVLHSRMGDTPLVLFFPGSYTGLKLNPFGKISSSNYYRAFELIPHGVNP
ncbi:DUF1788 domain-containing protein [Vibrio splendidus]|uniref:DUF1788 domain-containing protein n=1 Tax=Vibrio splendidus TaxID=29497 RepID=UPI0006CA5472|nr:DUF1788 domain-containing protein [Vibrio splendidus]KPM01482.1 cytoplasmic protein [Vibrio splendidus]